MPKQFRRLSLVFRAPPLLRGAILCRCDAQGIFAVPSQSRLVAAEHCFSFAVHCAALPLPFIGRLFLCWAIQSSASADLCLSITEQRIHCFAKAPQWLAIPSQFPAGPSSSVSSPLSSGIAFLPVECLAIGSLCCSKPSPGQSLLCSAAPSQIGRMPFRFQAVPHSSVPLLCTTVQFFAVAPQFLAYPLPLPRPAWPDFAKPPPILAYANSD